MHTTAVLSGRQIFSCVDINDYRKWGNVNHLPAPEIRSALGDCHCRRRTQPSVSPTSPPSHIAHCHEGKIREEETSVYAVDFKAEARYSEAEITRTGL